MNYMRKSIIFNPQGASSIFFLRMFQTRTSINAIDAAFKLPHILGLVYVSFRMNAALLYRLGFKEMRKIMNLSR